MIIKIEGGRVICPASKRDEIGDLWVEDGHIIDAPHAAPDEIFDAASCVVMAGGIDIHTHVAGGNVSMARLLLPELHEGVEAPPDHSPFATARWSTHETGRLYAQMGFTMAVEPAVAPTQAVQTQYELADLPYIDRAGLAVLGNDDFLLGLLRDGESAQAIADYTALTLAQSRCVGLKAINAGGAAAFRANARSFGLDEEVPHYGVTSRRIIAALQEAVDRLGVPHPLHLHCSNLGVPGAIDALVASMEAAEGRPLHLAHAQFYAYGAHEGGGIVPAVDPLVEAMARHKNVTLDVGQVMFGQTVTISSDVLRQYQGRGAASPKKWALWDGEGNGGGIVPFNYATNSHVSALQWAIGLEIFLRIEDPWRVFMTTDHPNGGPFTAYPKLIHLLMRADERDRWLEGLPASAQKATRLKEYRREYTIQEIIIMTRAAPARLLGLPDRGRLDPGARADIAVYRQGEDIAAMFEAAELVLKDGREIVRGGVAAPPLYGRTFALETEADAAMLRRFGAYTDRLYGAGPQILRAGEIGGRAYGRVTCLN